MNIESHITDIKRICKKAKSSKKQHEDVLQDLRLVCFTEQNAEELETVKTYVLVKLNKVNELFTACKVVLSKKSSNVTEEEIDDVFTILAQYEKLVKDPYLSRLERIYSKQNNSLAGL